MKKKLFVWTDHNPDYSSGLAFAIARTELEAKKLVVKAHGYPIENKKQFDMKYWLEHINWGDLTVYPVTKTIAFAVSGGS